MKDFKEGMISKLIDLLVFPVKSEDVMRLRKRIIRHNEELLVCFDTPMVEPTNNKAERTLRLPVILRKVIFGHRSDRRVNNFSTRE